MPNRKTQCGRSNPATLNMAVDFFTIWWYNQFNKSDFMKLIVIVKGECICGLSI